VASPPSSIIRSGLEALDTEGRGGLNKDAGQQLGFERQMGEEGGGVNIYLGRIQVGGVNSHPVPKSTKNTIPNPNL
jgi:hypothetical protein